MVLTLPITVWAERGHHGAKGSEFRCLNQLNLTADQESAIKGIRENYRPQLDTLHNDIRTARQEMRSAMSAQPFDEAQLRAAYQKMSPLHENMIVTRAKMKNEIRALLTADQKKAFDEKQNKHCEKGREQCANRQQGMAKCWMQPDTDETN
jgi:Spy/CpxP family protein refolding chaperone